MITRKQSITTAISVSLVAITAASLLHTAYAVALADHLVPPPLPLPQRLTHIRAPVVLQAQVQPQPYPHSYPQPYPQPHPQPHPQPIPVHTVASDSSVSPGFMTRIARWFGFGPGGGSIKGGKGGGAGTEVRDQQLSAATYAQAQYKQPPGKQSYAYQQPLVIIAQQQLQHVGTGNKAPCSNCNVFPWVPMLPPSIQYPLTQQYQQHQHQQQLQWAQSQSKQQSQASQQHLQKSQAPSYFGSVSQQQQTPVKQRAVQFNFPTLHNQLQAQQSNSYHGPPPAAPLTKPSLSLPQYPPLPFIPIPVPNLSGSALPPLYNAQPFRPVEETNQHRAESSNKHSAQELPSNEQAHFKENLGAHSEPRPDSVYPTQIPPTTKAQQDSSFEIIKSHQLTDFVASVEYPTTYVQSQAFDIGDEQLADNHKAVSEQTNTVRYQQETLSPELSSSHVPASQLLTEISSFGGANYQKQQQKQDTSLASTNNVDQTTFLYPQTQYHKYEAQTEEVAAGAEPQHFQQFESQAQGQEASAEQQQQHPQSFPQYQSQTQVLGAGSRNEVFYDSTANDNYPSASSHNFSAVEQAHRPDSLPNWTEESYSTLQSDELQYSTSPPPASNEISTQRSQQLENDFITERMEDSTKVEFLPAIQTEYKHQIFAKPQAKKPQRERETPKRLLDAPIAYHQQSNQNAPPRSFTRDASELNYRLGAASSTQPHEFQHANHAYTGEAQQHSTLPWLQPTAAPPQTVSSAAPTPTSTYGAIDASGHYAGMSPPAPVKPNDLHQIVIPYTTKNRPRPFEPTRLANPSKPNAFTDNWAHQNDVDPHLQQESKLVTTATNAPNNSPRTTKYLTRILASNLRELLKREHEVKNKSKNPAGFDFSRLQQNIDDWTEQEFTSLSHRPSTPTIRGRSKHIPTEYLTTTAATPRKSKTTHGFNIAELTSSINNLEPLLLDRGSKRYDYAPIVDNRISAYFEPLLGRKITSSTTTTTTPRPLTSPTKATSSTTTTTTTTEVTPYYIRAISTAEPTEVWQQARVSISPQTKERVYVVTPQPRFFPQRTVASTTEATLNDGDAESANTFKSPRFLVRPTPRDGSLSTSTSKPSYLPYAPQQFGLMGLSAFIPSEPVEIIDGNSKVITIATPSHEQKVAASKRQDTPEQQHTQQRRSTSKPTMSPSPR